MITEQFIIHKYLPVPYIHQGRSMQGFDCYGLVIAIYADLGIKLIDIEEDYTPDWSWKNRHTFLVDCHKDWKEVSKPKIFDVVTFKNSKGVMYHAGVMLDENRFINSCRAGTVVCRVSEPLWQKRFNGFYRNNKLI